MSVYDLASGALLLFVMLPLLAIATKVALDLPLVGVAFTALVAGLALVLYPHHGSRLVDITLGVLVVGLVVLAVGTARGFTRRSSSRARARVAPADFPRARVRRPGERPAA